MFSLKQKGFSLPEVMISLGLLGGISLMTMRLVEEQKNNETFFKARAEISKVVSLLKTTLNDSENCRYMLADNVIGTAGVTVTTLAIPLKVAGGTKEIIKSNTTYPDFRTQNITLISPSGAPPGTAELRISFKVKSKNMKLWGNYDQSVVNNSDRTWTETIPLLVSKNTVTSKLTDCGPIVSEANSTAKKKFCDSLGNAAVWNGTDCKFSASLTCAYGYVLTRLDNIGTPVCQQIKTRIDLNTLFDTNAICQNLNNNFSIVSFVPDASQPTVKKLKVQCN